MSEHVAGTTRPRLRNLGRLLVIILALSVALPSSALASTVPGNPGNLRADVNLYGCIGTSDNIHASRSSPGLVVARAWGQCSVPVAQIYVRQWLYRWDCTLGIFCGWDIVDDQNTTQFGPTVFDETIDASNCVVGGASYYSEAVEKFLGYDGIWYQALTGQPSTFVQC